MTWSFKGIFRRFLEAPDAGAYNELSPPGRGRIRYNNGGQVFEASVDGGPYLPFAGSSAGEPMVVAATIAALEATPVDSFENGTKGSVLTLRDTWTLLPSSGVAPDGITVVQADDGVRFWVRDQIANAFWLQQDTWYVDPAGGNDEARGSTVGSALASVDEIRRRLGKLPIGFLFINLLGNPGNITLDFNCEHSGGFVSSAVLISGIVTVVDSAVIVTATPHNNATRVFGSVDFAGDMSAQVGRMMRVADGPAAGGIAFALDTADGDVSAIDTGPFHDPATTNEFFPANGNTIEFCTLTQLSGVTVKAGCWASIADCQVTGSNVQESGGTLTFNRCRMDGSSTYYSTNWLSISQGVYYSAPALLIGENAARISSLTTWIRGRVGMSRGSDLNVQTNSSMCFYGRATASLAMFFDNSERSGAGTLVFYRFGAAASCIEAFDGSQVHVSPVWGRTITAGGSGNVLRVRSGSVMTYAASAVPDFAPNEDIMIGGTSGTISATLPLVNAANNAAIVIDA